MFNGITARGTDSAKVIEVIETKAMKGTGVQTDPVRIVTQYWSLDGKLLAECDPSALIIQSDIIQDEKDLFEQMKHRHISID